MGNDDETARLLVALVIIVLSMVLGAMFLSGSVYQISTPRTDLDPDKLYVVRGIASTGVTSTHLLLETAHDGIRYYLLPTMDLPADLLVGDKIVKYPLGIKREPRTGMG